MPHGANVPPTGMVPDPEGVPCVLRPAAMGIAMASSGEKHGGVAVDHTRQIPRLRRVEGQVRGLQQMIRDGRYCVDVAYQINAIIAALRRVQSDMLRDHLRACVEASLAGDIPEAERRRLVEEIAALLARPA